MHRVQCRGAVLPVFAMLALLMTGPVAAQSDPDAADRPATEAGRGQQIVADEEITVVGQRSLGLLRAEVQLSRERVYNLYNSLNVDDEFDIHCTNAPRTGTRIPQRVCRPQFVDSATEFAGTEFLNACSGSTQGLTESCLALAMSRGQAALSVVPGKERQLAEEVQRLTRENPEFRRAIVEYQAVERRYQEARGADGETLHISASIVGNAGPAVPTRLALPRGVVAPRAVDLVIPGAAAGGLDERVLREGWVKLRYSVLADGTTDDVKVVDAMPPGRDPSSAIVAAKAWTFEPATEAGVPIDWHNNLAVIVFEREETIHEGWVEFAEAYEAIVDLVSRERHEEAKSRIEVLRRELSVTLEEMAFAEMQLAAVEHALGDPHAALAASRRATEAAVSQLGEDELKLALEHRFTLELELGLAADALATYERRLDLGRLPSESSMARIGATLEPRLAAPETGLAVQRRIGSDGRGEHALTWPTFAVGDVDGRSDGLELQCNRSKTALPFEEDMQMAIPAGWGECVLFVKGSPDTTFIVYELREPID